MRLGGKQQKRRKGKFWRRKANCILSSFTSPTSKQWNRYYLTSSLILTLELPASPWFAQIIWQFQPHKLLMNPVKPESKMKSVLMPSYIVFPSRDVKHVIETLFVFTKHFYDCSGRLCTLSRVNCQEERPNSRLQVLDFVHWTLPPLLSRLIDVLSRQWFLLADDCSS